MGDTKPVLRASNASKLNTTLTRRVQKVFEINLQDKQFIESFEYLSSFYKGSVSNASKSLRGILEQKSLANNAEFLKEFGELNGQLISIQSELEQLENLCSSINNGVNSTLQRASVLVTKATALQTELNDVKNKEEQVRQFLRNYQLSEDEKFHLQKEINSQFFDALKKVRRIHQDCKALLVINHQQAGIEIMEETYSYLLNGYQSLFKFTHRQCLEVMCQPSPEVTKDLKDALLVLRDRPPLWMQCMQEIVKGRRNSLVNCFLEALRLGRSATKPLNISEDNSEYQQQFISDILAWVMQSIAEDKDILQAFFNTPKTKVRSAEDTDTAPQDVVPSIESLGVTKADLLDQIYEGICDVFRQKN